MKRAFLIFFAFLSLVLAATSQDKRGPSTPEERKRFILVTRKLMLAPLDESLNDDAKWALQWLADVPDVNVTPCPTPLGDLVPSDYKYAPRIFSIYVLSMGVYSIEHPAKAEDETPQYVAGVEGALKAYKAILKTKPGARSEELDDLADKQADGKLEAFVKTASRGCAAP
ncbi:MAG: hypothetical protein LAP21_01725 [Acidobacteriia bacterium]|nr:hypothetical protein [Terriglobia bacterium]